MLILWEGFKNAGWGKLFSKLKIFENHKESLLSLSDEMQHILIKPVSLH